MLGAIKKGKITDIKNGKAIVTPDSSGGIVISYLATPDRFFDKLSIGGTVFYAEFSDCTGIILEVTK